jgi:hypothetical protein
MVPTIGHYFPPILSSTPFLFPRNPNENGTYRWDLTRQLNVLCQVQLALPQGALQVDLLNLFTEIRFLVDESDKAIFDLEVYFGAFFDVGSQVAFCRYGEGFATVTNLMSEGCLLISVLSNVVH